ncbi:hypothetical protein [Plantactinospora endophytica]|uniref:hypothetical protein n=1 Tax=Plantactinospora endophytica TaxID=673535 RepID=UPI00194154FD|nr:hypothetical protein [Plantactinospora endophytica]
MRTALRILPALVATGLLAAGCTDPAPDTPPGPTATVNPGSGPAAGGTPESGQHGPAASGNPGSGRDGPAASGPVPAGAGTTISCAHVIDRSEAPPEGWTVLADAVALTPDRLQPSSTGGSDPARLFAKTGLLVRADARVDLIVPATSAGRPWIGWGSPARPARTLHFPGCAAESGWLAFAGGFWVDAPACVPLTIRSTGREQQSRPEELTPIEEVARIEVGVDCPG